MNFYGKPLNDILHNCLWCVHNLHARAASRFWEWGGRTLVCERIQRFFYLRPPLVKMGGGGQNFKKNEGRDGESMWCLQYHTVHPSSQGPIQHTYNKYKTHTTQDTYNKYKTHTTNTTNTKSMVLLKHNRDEINIYYNMIMKHIAPVILNYV